MRWLYNKNKSLFLRLRYVAEKSHLYDALQLMSFAWVYSRNALFVRKASMEKKVLLPSTRISLSSSEKKYLTFCQKTMPVFTKFYFNYGKNLSTILYFVSTLSSVLLDGSTGFVYSRNNEKIALYPQSALSSYLSDRWEKYALPKKRKKLQGKYVSIFFSDKEENYYHLHIDLLSRLSIVATSDAKILKEYVLLIRKNSSPKMKSLIEFFCAKYGVRFETIEEDVAYEIDSYLFLSFCSAPYSGYLPEKARDFVRGLVFEYAQKQQDGASTQPAISFPKKIFVSRKRAARNISNEEALYPTLKKRGYVIVYTEDYSHANQIRLFSQITHAIIPHGAACTNLLFCKKGVKVIEIVSRSQVLPYYLLLSKSVGLMHRCLIGSRFDVHGNFTVDPKSFEKAMKNDVFKDKNIGVLL